MTDGYIIASGKNYLTKNLFWFPHDDASDAFVFPEWQVKDILDIAQRWSIQPTHLYRATFENGTVTVHEKLEKV